MLMCERTWADARARNMAEAPTERRRSESSIGMALPMAHRAARSAFMFHPANLEVTMAQSQGRRPNDLVIPTIVEQFGDVPETEIASRAYELYEQRGGAHGHDVDDWLLAERELRLARRSAAA